MPAIDWNAVSGQPAQSGGGGAIDWNAVTQTARIPTPQSAPKSGQQQVLEQMNPIERGLAGIGGGMMGLYLGAKQRLGLADQNEINDFRANMDPLAATKAGLVGQVIGAGAAAAPAMLIPGANTALGAALVGGGTGALQPTKADESVLQNVGLGAAGGVAGKYIGDIAAKGASALNNKIGSALAERLQPQNIPLDEVSSAAAGLTDAQRSAAAAGKQLGMKLTPGQATGSKPLQMVEAAAESYPITAGPFSNIKQTNQTVLNQQAAKAIGETSKTVDSTVLGRAADRIGGVYDEVKATGNRTIDPDQFLNNLGDIEKNYEGLIGEGTKSIADHPLVKRLMNYAAKGDASAEQLADLGSKLTKASNQAMTSPMGDRQLGMALGDVKSQVDDLLQAGLPSELAQRFGDARSQYRNLMVLTSRKNIVNPSNGNVNGRALASALQAKDRAGFLFGRNESPLYDAARFSQAFPAIVGDSGTATRSFNPGNPVNVALSVPAWLASQLYTTAPSVALARGLSAGSTTVENAVLRGAQKGAALTQFASPVVGAPLGAALLESTVPQKKPTKR